MYTPNAYHCATLPWLCPSFLPMRPTMRAICATMQCTIFEKTPQRYGQRYHVIMLTWLYVIISATSRGGFPAINNELMINSLLMIVNAYLRGSDFNHKIVLLLLMIASKISTYLQPGKPERHPWQQFPYFKCLWLLQFDHRKDQINPLGTLN